MPKINQVLCVSLYFVICLVFLFGCSAGINEKDRGIINTLIDEGINEIEKMRITEDELKSIGIPQEIIPFEECSTQECMNQTMRAKSLLLNLYGSRKNEIGNFMNKVFIDVYSVISKQKIVETKFEIIIKKLPKKWRYLDEIRKKPLVNILDSMLFGKNKGSVPDSPPKVIEDNGKFVDNIIAVLN